MLKEQKKLRSRLARKSHEKREVEKDLEQLLTNHMSVLKKYRIEKIRANDLDKKIHLITFYSKIVVYSLIASLLTNLYFIFK